MKENNEESRKYGSRYRVAVYLTPLYYRFLKNLSDLTEESESSCLLQFTKKHFDAMSEQERNRILNFDKQH